MEVRGREGRGSGRVGKEKIEWKESNTRNKQITHYL